MILKRVENGRTNVGEPLKYTVGASAVSQGAGLVLSSGKLIVAGATTKPTFYAVSAGAANTSIAVIPITPEMVFEATGSVSLSSAVVGTKVTLTSDSTQVTATTTSGVATLVSIAADGLSAMVRFE